MAHGGIRPGAGRPRSVTRVAQENQIVAKKLRGGAELGWEVLADRYPALIRLAVEVAQGEHSEGKPNTAMLKTLLELLPRVVSADADPSDSPLTGLLGDIRAIIREGGADRKPYVDSSLPSGPTPTHLSI